MPLSSLYTMYQQSEVLQGILRQKQGVVNLYGKPEHGEKRTRTFPFSHIISN
ncbi:hypothetical protein EMPG_16259 [Blastomyces silverae]|uniref:Uncharacterized protein n=1 Tax=Blastomyces silverae TaxID=2060906 RepID=A0A0H1BA62_9EURO|nr:hypothetical protein EMPG_16259 [Blastomyces silverae]